MGGRCTSVAVELESRPDATERPAPPPKPAVFSAPTRPPMAVIRHVRVVLALLLTAFVLVTAAGALLLLMAWRQESTDGLASGQTERLWDIWEVLADIERYIALAAMPIAVVWTLVAALNVMGSIRRAKWSPLAAFALIGAFIGVWAIGDQVVRPADDHLTEALGIVAQAGCVIVAMLFFDRLAAAAEARRRPLHMTAVMAIAYLVVLQLTGAISTIDRTTDFDGWQRGATFVLIATLIQLLGTLAANEAMRAIEEGTEHRYELRARFGEAAG